MSSAERRDNSRAPESTPEPDASRSTARPPTDPETPEDLAGAVQRAKANPSPGRYGPPAATAKIRPFQLAEALAKLSAAADTSSMPPAPTSQRSRDAVQSELRAILGPGPAVDIITKASTPTDAATTAPPPVATTEPPPTVTAPRGYGEEETTIAPLRQEQIELSSLDTGWTPKPMPVAEKTLEPKAAAKKNEEDEEKKKETENQAPEEAEALPSLVNEDDAPIERAMREAPAVADAIEPATTEEPPQQEQKVIRGPRPLSPQMILAMIIGVAAIVYAYVVTNR